jgi:rod shape-determining protein MreD
MNRWTYSLLVLFLIPVQTTWLNGLSLNDIKPNLALLLIYFTGFYAGEINGMAAGLAAGALMDLLSGGPFGLNIASLAMMGLASGLVGRFFIHTTATLTMGLVFILSILNGLLTFSFHQWVVGGIPFNEVFRWTILPEALYNTAVGSLLFLAGIGRLKTQKTGSDPGPFSISIG